MVLLFSILNRVPKEDGGREAKLLTARRMIRCGAGFLPSPLLCGVSGNGKSFNKNSTGDQHTRKTGASAGALSV